MKATAPDGTISLRNLLGYRDLSVLNSLCQLSYFSTSMIMGINFTALLTHLDCMQLPMSLSGNGRLTGFYTRSSISFLADLGSLAKSDLHLLC